MAFIDKRHKRFWILIIVGMVAGWGVFSLLENKSDSGKPGNASEPVPVNVAPVQRGPIELRRMFSGTLEATAQFVVAPKVGGRVEALLLDLSDPVVRGQEVARLDNEEYVQAVVQARADLAVAKANLAEAKSALEIAIRELGRIRTLFSRGVASESQLDVVLSTQLQKQAGVDVTQARLARAEAVLETANIQLGYTRITADWTGGDSRRVVAERHIDEGNTVSANDPLLTIVELDPITGVIFITEKDYGRLKIGQSVALITDAFPDESFTGRIARIAPVFNQATRQARIEMTIDNPAHRLKPGMFIRATVVFDRVLDAIIVPEQALTRRSDRTGVFLVANGSPKAVWREVEAGIRENGRVQIRGENLSGRVVILGQELLEDGSSITISEDHIRAGGDPE